MRSGQNFVGSDDVNNFQTFTTRDWKHCTFSFRDLQWILSKKSNNLNVTFVVRTRWGLIYYSCRAGFWTLKRKSHFNSQTLIIHVFHFSLQLIFFQDFFLRCVGVIGDIKHLNSVDCNAAISGIISCNTPSDQLLIAAAIIRHITQYWLS